MTTFTLEPLDYDGFGSQVWTVTQLQLGGVYGPYKKVAYIANGTTANNNVAIERLNTLMTNGTIQAGDTVMGFSLGSQNIMSYLSRYTPTPGVDFILCGCTAIRNQNFLDNPSIGGIPWDIANNVYCIAREYDGYSDYPTRQSAAGYSTANQTATDGSNATYPNLHHYVHARLGHASNVVTWRGNIKFELVPTQVIPGGRSETLRPTIDAAYERPVPSASQRTAAASVQVNPAYPPYASVQTPETVA